MTTALVAQHEVEEEIAVLCVQREVGREGGKREGDREREREREMHDWSGS